METKSGFLGHMTSQQTEALKELKEIVEQSELAEALDKHPDGDKYLLRMLRATMKDKGRKRIFKPELAFKRLSEVLNWKADNLEEVKTEDFQVFEKAYPNYHFHDKKQGTLVWINRIGEFTNTVKSSHLTIDKWKQCAAHQLERAEDELREIAGPDNEFTGYISIADVKGLGLGALTRTGIVTALSNTAADNYPELVGKVYLINTPWIFPKIFALIKPLIDKDTLSKFEIYSSTPKDRFRELFDTKLLPQEYGGDSEFVVPYPIDSKKYKE
mmetsp:Transcript_12646/g.14501  ORF Transcript_12646/g.14501 Transcript_12646/m.14501 type:complete len:271 (+) Transcript_12646:163-975(+)|eukprot:CAMPEP_0184041216 /NCGR_PEP_ID=MMETSP0955-20130417/61246_1 /TAXON_ID=627963 /ORGANISM="Aplanochytrium sp, Strain PBS07" /LENGTH=270 /DNA_ID=CAMNT_0026331379 /DNA_START=135 /DNA_END=947 /DNA_ORIENTATION=+